MRFCTFFILVCLGIAAVGVPLNLYSALVARERMVPIGDYRDGSSMARDRRDRDSGWGERPPQYLQPALPPFEQQQSPPESAHDSFPPMGINDDVNSDGSTDFEWPRFAMALVLLTGGTLVCRRIFRSAAGPCRLTQLRQRPQPAQPSRPAPPAALALSRMCPRTDCGRMNPPMAKFCRRCGTALSDV